MSLTRFSAKVKAPTWLFLRVCSHVRRARPSAAPGPAKGRALLAPLVHSLPHADLPRSRTRRCPPAFVIARARGVRRTVGDDVGRLGAWAVSERQCVGAAGSVAGLSDARGWRARSIVPPDCQAD